MIARVLMTLGLALGVLSYAFVLLPIDLGIWPRVEPIVIAVHLAAALGAVGLAVGCASGDGQALGAVRHPVVLIAAFFAAWSALVAPFADYPWLSLIGMAQSGEGTLMKADFAVFVAAALAVRRSLMTTDALAALAAGVSWVAAVLILPVPQTRIWGIEDYLAYYAFPVAALIASRIGGTKGALLGVVAAFPALLVSTNAAAAAALIGLAAPVYLIAVWWRRAARSLGVVVSALIPFAMAAAVVAIGSRDLIASIRARELIFDVAARDVSDHPWTLLHGRGWGHTGEMLFTYLSSTRAKLWDETWDIVFRDHFHTLNHAVEAAMSAGLPAALASVALFAAVPLFAPRRRVALAGAFAVAQTALASLWFEMPMTVPVVALAFAMLVTPLRVRAARWVALPLAAVAAAQIAAAVLLLDWGVGMRAALGRDTWCEDWPRESWRAEIGLRAAFLDLKKSTFENHGRAATVEPATLSRLDSLRCAIDARALDTRSPMLASAPVLFRNDVALTPGYAALHPGFAESLEDWPQRLRVLLALAPRRTDLAMPYLATLVTTGRFVAAGDLADDILRRDPADPVGLWFSGIALIQSPDSERQRAAFALLRRGLEHGIERILPVPAELKARILALSQGSGPSPPSPP